MSYTNRRVLRGYHPLAVFLLSTTVLQHHPTRHSQYTGLRFSGISVTQLPSTDSWTSTAANSATRDITPILTTRKLENGARCWQIGEAVKERRHTQTTAWLKATQHRPSDGWKKRQIYNPCRRARLSQASMPHLVTISQAKGLSYTPLKLLTTATRNACTC